MADKDYPNHRCIESWLPIIQRAGTLDLDPQKIQITSSKLLKYSNTLNLEFFQPDATIYYNFIRLLVATKLPIAIDLFESAIKSLSPNINYAPSDELKSLIENHKMLFTVVQELLANKAEDPVGEPDPMLAKV